MCEENSFVPCAKIVGEEQYSIVSDYLGTPTHAYNADGIKVWERELDIYGAVRKGNNEFIPFLYLGQYVDRETGLTYNRFGYYDQESGCYISQDPIGLEGRLLNFYGYVKDPNSWVDIFGLSGEIVYQLVNDGKVVYYGITNRTALERMAEHGKTKVFDNMEVLADGLTHDQTRFP